MDSNYYYFFEIIYWEDQKRIKTQGIVYGSSYSDAIEQLSQCYGEDSIEEIRIYIGEDFAFEISEEEFELHKKQLFFGKELKNE